MWQHCKSVKIYPHFSFYLKMFTYFNDITKWSILGFFKHFEDMYHYHLIPKENIHLIPFKEPEHWDFMQCGFILLICLLLFSFFWTLQIQCLCYRNLHDQNSSRSVPVKYFASRIQLVQCISFLKLFDHDLFYYMQV